MPLNYIFWYNIFDMTRYEKKPIVAIVGRPNVGKSTLFNRLSGRKIAIVEQTPGVTRDRLYANCEWFGTLFALIDTGGIQLYKADFAEEIRKQVDFAINEASVIIFVVDGRDGITPDDWDIAEILRRTGKRLILAVNKVESKKRMDEALEFHALGFEDTITVSALHGLDVDMLLDKICDYLPPQTNNGEEEDDEKLHLAIVGRPNVGKSSLLNTILKQERSIVSEIAGTTRDAVDIDYEWKGTEFVLTDTAGIRRKSKVDEDVEYYSVVRAFGAIERCDVAVVLLDAVEGLTEQDKRIIGHAHEHGVGIIVAVNKWDERLNLERERFGLIEDNKQLGSKERKAMLDEFTTDLRRELVFVAYAPLVFISALKKKGIEDLLATVIEVAEQHATRIPTSELNRLIRDAAFDKPTSRRGKMLKIYYATQVKVKPPTIVLFVNDTSLVHFSTERYLENQIREKFSLEGTSLKIVVRESSGEESEMKPRNRRAKKTREE